MSYILDALKKLEHDRSKKSRAGGMINISGALFEHERTKPAGTAGWKIALAVTLAVLVTFGATWLLLGPGKGRKNPALPLAAKVSPVLPPVPVAIATSPLPPVAPVVPVVPVQPSPPATAPVPAAATTVRPSAPPSRPQETVVQAAPASEEDDDEGRASRRRTRGRKDQPLPAVQVGPAPAVQAGPAPADIKLSGIAWQEERRSRRAVVNGFLMKEGGVVSGARITDIYQNRVRFSLSGKTFEIPLISSDVPAAGK